MQYLECTFENISHTQQTKPPIPYIHQFHTPSKTQISEISLLIVLAIYYPEKQNVC